MLSPVLSLENFYKSNQTFNYSSNSSFNILTTSKMVSSSKSVLLTKSATSYSNTLFAVSRPILWNSSIIQPSISSENSLSSTSSSAPSRSTSISYPVNCPAKRMLCPPLPIALLTSSGCNTTSACLVSSSILTEITFAGLNARVMNKLVLVV